MASEQYNGRSPQTRLIPAGTELHRISGTATPYPPNLFNRAAIRPLGDPLQGRFEPIDTSHGGYLYVALSLPGAVAEGILRNIAVPAAASFAAHVSPEKHIRGWSSNATSKWHRCSTVICSH